MPELDEKKRIIDYNTVNDPDENYYALIDNGTSGTGKVSIKGLGPANMISDAYSDQDTYAVGDVCIHNNILYVCNTEIDTPHAFDLSEWDPDTLGNYCSKLNGDVTEIKSSLSNLDGSVSSLISGLSAQSLLQYTGISSTETSYNTITVGGVQRKFSDYRYLLFILQYNQNDYRDLCLINSSFWTTSASIVRNVLHGAGGTTGANYNVSGVTYKYNSDTSLKAVTGGAGAFQYIQVLGIGKI